jgi:hypothetical protein
LFHVLALLLQGYPSTFFLIAKRTVTDLWSRPQFYHKLVYT